MIDRELRNILLRVGIDVKYGKANWAKYISQIKALVVESLGEEKFNPSIGNDWAEGSINGWNHHLYMMKSQYGSNCGSK